MIRAAILALCAVMFCGGCVTMRVKTATVRAEKYAKQKGVEGDALGAAIGREMGAVNRELGTEDIDPETVPLNAEAADSNAKGIDQARETRQEIVSAGKGLLGSAGPWGAGVLAALSVAGGLYTRLRKYRATLETVVEGVGDLAHKDTKDRIRTLAVDAGLQPFLDKIVQKIDPPEVG